MDPVNGHFLTADPFYSTSEYPKYKPDFKKSTSKKDNTPPTDETDNFVEKIQQIDLGEYRLNDVDQYRQLIQDTLSLCEDEIVTPYISQTFALGNVNQAVKFIKEKKCTGKVLIDLKLEKSTNGDADDDSDNESGNETDNETDTKKTKTKGKAKE